MRIAREPQPALGAALRQLRHDAKLTQEALEEKTGIHRTWISQIEQGRSNPAWGTVLKLTGALGASLKQLAELIEQIELE